MHWVVGAVLGLVLVGALPLDASAQIAFLPDRQNLQGAGFRVRNLEIHPSFQGELAWDSNVFLNKDNTTSSVISRLSARVAASSLTNQRLTQGDAPGNTPLNRKLSFRGTLGAEYYHYFSHAVSDNVAADANLDLHIRPDAPVSLRLYDRFLRQIRPFVDAPPTGPTPSFGMNQNAVGAMVQAQTRGGVLRGQLGYEFGFVFFDSSLFNANNYLAHRLSLGGQWQFLPRTSLFQTTTVDLQRYTDPAASTSNTLSDNNRVVSTVGLNGVITQKISLTVSGGYSAGFYKLMDSFSGVTARAELRYRPIQTIQTSIGYTRDFLPSWLGNYQRTDMLYLSSQLMIRGKALLGARVGLSFNETGEALTPTGAPVGNSTRRNDTRVNGEISAEYRATSWLGITATLGYVASFTNYDYVVTMPGTIIPDPGSGYQRFDAWLGLRVFY